MPNPYVNKVAQSDGTTLIDISDTTAEVDDVVSGKFFYLASGEKAVGTRSGVDANTTYTLSISGNVITLTGSDGQTSSVTLPVYNGGVS